MYLLWVASFPAMATLHVALILGLMPVLNPRFDPDWKRRRWSAFEQGWQPFFGPIRSLNYGGAVAFPFLARRLFGDSAYNFRGGVGAAVYWLCVLQQLLGLYLLVSVVPLALVVGL